ncbi:MAG: hypothetical protein ACMUEL_01965 [Flavobacteriales bacterium Tduv]
MIVDFSITVSPFSSKGFPIYVVEGSRKREKVNQLKKSKEKRDPIRSRE